MTLSPARNSSSTGSKIEGFLSYAHQGDELLEFVEPLHRGLINMIKLRANREIEIFRDRKSIKWGNRWESTIENGLESASVLFVVATTHYLDSEACRDEFTTFLNAAKATGKAQATRLILPIMPLDASSVFHKKSADPIAREIAQIQYELIEDAVLDGEGSPAWRRAMKELTVRFMEVVDEAEKALSGADEGDDEDDGEREVSERTPTAGTIAGTKSRKSSSKAKPSREVAYAPEADEQDDLITDDDRGIVDLAADIEQDLGEVADLATTMTTAMEGIGKAVRSVDLSKPSSAKESSVKFQTIAQKLKPHSQALGDKGAELRMRVSAIDVALRRLVVLHTHHGDQSYIENIKGQLTSIESSLSEISNTEDQMDALLTTMTTAEVASSAVRKALTPMRSGITAYKDAARIMQSWGPGLLPGAKK